VENDEAGIAKKKSESASEVENRAKAQAVRTSLGEIETDSSVEYKSHSQGGYAVSRRINNLNARKPNHRIIAQRYLLEQIKNGWPYDEKFYRSDTNTAIISQGSRPTAIVHFPTL